MDSAPSIRGLLTEEFQTLKISEIDSRATRGTDTKGSGSRSARQRARRNLEERRILENTQRLQEQGLV